MCLECLGYFQISELNEVAGEDWVEDSFCLKCNKLKNHNTKSDVLINQEIQEISKRKVELSSEIDEMFNAYKSKFSQVMSSDKSFIDDISEIHIAQNDHIEDHQRGDGNVQSHTDGQQPESEKRRDSTGNEVTDWTTDDVEEMKRLNFFNFVMNESTYGDDIKLKIDQNLMKTEQNKIRIDLNSICYADYINVIDDDSGFELFMSNLKSTFDDDPKSMTTSSKSKQINCSYTFSQQFNDDLFLKFLQ